MEVAAERIIELASAGLKPDFRVSISQMTDDYERVGFVELLAQGWLSMEKATPDLDNYRYNGCFFVTAQFLNRIGAAHA